MKVWRASDGILCRTLQGHAHWVNTLALNVDYVLRTGPFDPTKRNANQSLSAEEAQKIAFSRYEAVCKICPERLVSGSDDFTLFLWDPTTDKKPLGMIVRLTRKSF